jgi:hypothetical protein
METASVLTTPIQIPRMSTVKLFVKADDFTEVFKHVTMSGAKYYPVRRWSRLEPVYTFGYKIELEKDHPIVSFLILMYELVQID